MTEPYREWHSKVIDYLCELKAADYTFDKAWELAINQHKPRARDIMPEERPTLFAIGIDDETTVEFLHRVCSDAWHDRNPRLRHVAGLRDGDLDTFMTVTDAR